MLTQTRTQNALALTTEAANLCRRLSEKIEKLSDLKENAGYDLDIYTYCHFEIERVTQLWNKADKRYIRRLNQI